MNLEALVLLDGDAAAQRALITWPVAYRGEPVDLGPDGEGLLPEELWARWEAFSGVDREDLQRLYPMLVGSGIIDGDEIAPAARAYVQQQVVDKLPPSVRQRIVGAGS